MSFNFIPLFPDSRTNNFPLVSNPLPILVILYVYHRFVGAWGPALMANRPPYNIKKLIIVYNVIQIGLSGYLTVQVSKERETVSSMLTNSSM